MSGALYVLVNMSTLVLNDLVVLAVVGSFANGDAGLSDHRSHTDDGTRSKHSRQ